MKRILPLFFLASLATNPAQSQNRIHVNHAATGANTGSSWADAFTDLQAALALAQADDEVWVAQGTYRPTGGADRKISFEPKSRVRLYGGFAGTETDLAQRDWQAYPTVLSGDIGVPDDSTDNSYNVVYLRHPDVGTVLDGFTIRHGNADDTQAAFTSRDRPICGGGLYIMAEDAEAYPDIVNCRFERNTAYQSGGAVMVNAGGDGSALPVFRACVLADNRAVRNGGGMARFGGSWEDRGPFLRDCRFERNNAGQRGGGLYQVMSSGTDSLVMTGCVFKENSSSVAGGGVFFLLGRPDKSYFGSLNTVFFKNAAGEGAALDLFSNGSPFEGDIVIDFNFFLSNTTNSNPIINEPSILYVVIFGENGRFEINRTMLKDNQSGGRLSIIECQVDSLSIYGTHFINNSKNGIYGGQAFLIASLNVVSFNECVFKKNINYQTIIHVPNNNNVFIQNSLFNSNKMLSQSNWNNSIVQNDGSPLQMNVINSTFTNNNKSAILNFNQNINETQISTFHLSNTIYQDTARVNHFPHGWKPQTLLTHSYFDTLNCAALPPNITCGPGMIIGGDPMFVAPDSGDYRLQPCSPLVNAGSNAYVSTPTDLAGNPRIEGSTVDIGAYEHQGPALAAAPTAQPSCPGGASGGIGIEVQEACPPVAVAWQSGAASGTILSGLPPGEYQITVTDSKGLTLAFSATVPVGDTPTLTTLPTPVACGDTLGGSAAVSVSGATAPLAFDWGTLGSDSLLSGLPPGLYPVTVTDARGCTAVGSVQVDRSGNLGVDITAQPVSCHGAADGSLTVLPANGKAPFAWNWSNPPGAATPTVGPLGPGTYEGTLTDAFGCTIGWVLPLGQPGPLQPSAFVTDATDSAKADGAILLIPLGGTGPYSALWAGGQTGLLLDSLPPGAYMATVTDANGCTAATPAVLVGVTTAAGEPDAAAGWQVLPNPASTVLSVLLEDAAPAPLRVRLWGGEGRLAQEGVLPAGAERLVLDVGDLPRGMYFVQVGAAVRKVVLR